MNGQHTAPCIVVGGGLAGLTAATYLARGGRSVTVLEEASNLGGRARTQTREGYHLNMGPHALYLGGQAKAVLQELEVTYSGGKPALVGAGVRDGRIYRLPTTTASLLTTDLLGIGERLEAGRILATLSRLDFQAIARISVESWVQQQTRHERVRQLLRATIRTSTYANDPERQSAGAALQQVQLAISKGVLYLDGEWQTLVDGVKQAAIAAGVQIVTSAKVTGVAPTASGWMVQRADGSKQQAAAVILAVDPAMATALAAHEGLRTWATHRHP